MKTLKIILLLTAIVSLTSCASSYKTIHPNDIAYVSAETTGDVKLEYKYELLHKKYEKKETKKGVKLVAVKITNNSGHDLTFGRDLTLEYANGNEIHIMDNDNVFKTLKQHPATHLFYLLLTPLNLYTTKTNEYGFEEQTSSFPIGLIVGPGLAAGNLITASTANKKFRTELEEFNIHGSTIKSGETKAGLIGIRSESFEALKLKLKPELQVQPEKKEPVTKS
ncbi:MAG: hypothetical protein WBL27_13160 [Salinimicrobium sp.]